jgi:cysteine-rich repeat protein
LEKADHASRWARKTAGNAGLSVGVVLSLSLLGCDGGDASNAEGEVHAGQDDMTMTDDDGAVGSQTTDADPTEEGERGPGLDGETDGASDEGSASDAQSGDDGLTSDTAGSGNPDSGNPGSDALGGEMPGAGDASNGEHQDGQASTGSEDAPDGEREDAGASAGGGNASNSEDDGSASASGGDASSDGSADGGVPSSDDGMSSDDDSEVNLDGLDLRWGLCAGDGELSCYGIDQRIQLICYDYTPEVYGVCATDERCDTREENAGNCEKMLPECVGQQPHFGLCDGDTYFECGVNKLTRSYEEACSDRCVARADGADCIHAGCGNGTVDAGEACDDGNNDHGDGCSATCQWGPPLGEAVSSRDFGSSVAIDGDRIAVSGVVSLEERARSAIYVFKRDGIAWLAEDVILLDEDPGLQGARMNDRTDALALSGDTLAFGGSMVDDGEQESVFILRRAGSEWSFEARVTPALADGEADETHSFAHAIDLDGDVLVVGADGDADQGSYAGAAYVYRRTGSSWSPEAKLHAQLADGTLDGEASDGFGMSVAVSGSTIVVGALGDADAGSFTGAAYVYVGSQGAWAPQAKLLGAGSSDAEEGAQCGSSVDVQGDTIVVGCHYAREVDATIDPNDLGNYAGAAYVFRRANASWQRNARLLPLPAQSPEEDKSIAEFGGEVAISDDENLIAVGSPRDLTARGRIGSAHVFVEGSGAWMAQKLVPETPRGVGVGEGYGGSLAVSGQSVVAGGPGSQGGRAYLYQTSGDVWQERVRLLAVVP